MDCQPVVVGLVGGIASGKSRLAGFLGGLGARVVDADRIAHEVLGRPEVVPEIVARLGSDVLDATGRPDRDRIGRLVFSDPEKLARLEAVLHPLVRERVRSEIEAAGDVPAVVLDVPLLLEGGLLPAVDVLVLVTADEATRRDRAARDRGWGPDEIRSREERQLPIEKKRLLARFAVRNDGSLEDLEERAGDLFRDLLEWGRKKRQGDEDGLRGEGDGPV